MFYDNLKAICDEKGLKITPIVAECGGAKGSISNWKKGVMPNSEIVAKLAIRLNVSTDMLIFGNDRKSQYDMSNANIGAIGSRVNGTLNVGNNIYSTHVSENSKDETDEIYEEITKILKELPLRERTKLLNLIYEFEDNYKRTCID